ncbi:LOW QUALITY PROTEIN: dapper homolog 2-like [Perognathus longimembris pacificus]|uniref:LOW QUALITY PROTEIN: dapper homolog 2-like n=1 Tax=Perognathus longimembris pacificus TaxID=214514 RepID=UPI002019AF2D|nr:LOW QUALITY PROTEIN: dapper homolog 2-like [Perognathus longimembris pacificus]
MWAPGAPSGPAGWDRRRVGARLRAALAGLHELQGLRAAHQARVRGALAAQPPPPGGPDPRGARGPELRLEATLAALQEQLSRLRRRDTGLKTHLDQLGQQIGELQLDVCRPSCDALDSDSRPSSGFYELSDVGSSCASVCSERLSPSPGTGPPVFPPAKARPGVGDWRPRSADETSVPTRRPPATEEGARPPRERAENAGQPCGVFRPRPVSTGDLERVLPADRGPHSAGPDSAPAAFFCPGLDIPSQALDPTYQRDLVSRGGQEVYAYPSPLHAVALQSPLFALTKETPQRLKHSPPETPPLGAGSPSGTQAGPVHALGTAGAYIDRLLNLRVQRAPQRSAVGAQGPPGCGASRSPQRPRGRWWAGGGRPGEPGRTPGEDAPGAVPSGAPSRDGPPPWSGHVDREPAAGPAPCTPIPQHRGDGGPGGVPSPSGKGARGSPLRAPGPCVRPARTAREASPAGLKAGLPPPQAARARSRAGSRAPRPGKPPPAPPGTPRGFHAVPVLPLAWDPQCRPPGGGPRGRPVLARGAPGRSCSESTLYPVPLLVPLVVARREGYLSPGGPAPLGPPSRRKQRRWQSTVEISAQGRPASRPEPSAGPPRPVTRKASSPGAQSKPPLARQDACTRGGPEPSEEAAECASLFHATIAETSEEEEEEEEEEEASDHTTSRFGDQESSSSDTECRVQSSSSSPAADRAEAVRGAPAWPGEPPQSLPKAPRGARPPLPPVPKLCRIKASKALKKKIRRFQPTALKVMTMV